MYSEVVSHCSNCPQCAIVNSSGRVNRPPLHPIPVERVFQIIGVDIMDLPKTNAGNKHVVVFQDFLSKYPLVFPVPDQKNSCIVKLLVEELVPHFGVPEALLSDRGTNLLSHLMKDVCKLLGIHKLTTTAYPPQCDGMVERFNRTLKTILRKHASQFGNQWDSYLPGVLWAYRNTPHDSTGEKPSFLLYGHDLRTPTEACSLPTTPSHLSDIDDYREELMVSLTSARETAAQQKYKRQYDKRATYTTTPLKTGNWVLVRFPQDETDSQDPGMAHTGSLHYLPLMSLSLKYISLRTSLSVFTSLESNHAPRTFYWYGGKRRGPGRPPKWVSAVLDTMDSAVTASSSLPGNDDDDQSRTLPSSLIPPSDSTAAHTPKCKYPLRNRRQQSGRPSGGGGGDVTGMYMTSLIFSFMYSKVLCCSHYITLHNYSIVYVIT